jgi:hypothetical protein
VRPGRRLARHGQLAKHVEGYIKVETLNLAEKPPSKLTVVKIKPHDKPTSPLRAQPPS